MSAEDSSLSRYLSEVKSSWGDGKDPGRPYRVKTLLEQLLSSTSEDEPWMAKLIKEAEPAKELYRDPECGFVQMGHIRLKEHSGSPHEIGPLWLLYGVYRGEVEMTTYRRKDSGSTNEPILERKDVQRLTPGVVSLHFHGEIHAPRTIRPPSVVLRLLSHGPGLKL